jgi:cation:H+ antiporter
MLIDIAAIIGGLTLLIWGADRFVHGGAATARNLGVPPLLIGLTVVACATSAPEILVSVVAAWQGNTDLAIGNAIGSNIANIGLVLGAVALLRPIEMKSATLRREVPALLAVTLLTVSLFLDLTLSRIDGLVLLLSLVIVMIWMVKLGIKSAENDPIRTDFEAEIPEHEISMAGAIFWLIAGLLILLAGAELMVSGATSIARTLGVSEIVIGVTLVALATSLPELAVSLVAAVRGEYGMAIGNIIGSNIFNLLAVIGVAITIHPTVVAESVLTLHMFVLIGFTIVLFAMTYYYGDTARIDRRSGVALLTAYVAYTSYVISQNL